MANMTIRDIAQRSGLSKPMVFLVLNDSPKVSAERHSMADINYGVAKVVEDTKYEIVLLAKTLRSELPAVGAG